MRKPHALAALAASVLLLAGCELLQEGTEAPDADTETEEGPDGTPEPDPDDDFQSLDVNMVAESGTYFPDGIDGITFGCSDTLVSVSTVPTYAEDPEELVASAIEFLLDDSQYYHGDPPVTNSLTMSETLDISSVEVDGDSVDIRLTGDVIVRGECEAYRIQAQMYGTAASTVGVEDISITVEGTELNEVLGLEPFDTSQLLEHDPNTA